MMFDTGAEDVLAGGSCCGRGLLAKIHSPLRRICEDGLPHLAAMLIKGRVQKAQAAAQRAVLSEVQSVSSARRCCAFSVNSC